MQICRPLENGLPPPQVENGFNSILLPIQFSTKSKSPQHPQPMTHLLTSKAGPTRTSIQSHQMKLLTRVHQAHPHAETLCRCTKKWNPDFVQSTTPKPPICLRQGLEWSGRPRMQDGPGHAAGVQGHSRVLRAQVMPVGKNLIVRACATCSAGRDHGADGSLWGDDEDIETWHCHSCGVLVQMPFHWQFRSHKLLDGHCFPLRHFAEAHAWCRRDLLFATFSMKW